MLRAPDPRLFGADDAISLLKGIPIRWLTPVPLQTRRTIAVTATPRAEPE